MPYIYSLFTYRASLQHAPFVKHFGEEQYQHLKPFWSSMEILTTGFAEAMSLHHSGWEYTSIIYCIFLWHRYPYFRHLISLRINKVSRLSIYLSILPLCRSNKIIFYIHIFYWAVTYWNHTFWIFSPDVSCIFFLNSAFIFCLAALMRQNR